MVISRCYILCVSCVLGMLAQCAFANGKAEYWRLLDKNADGFVDAMEYQSWMMYGFHQRDRDGDHELRGGELPNGQMHPITEEQQRKRLLQQFKAQDTDHNGLLSPQELFAPPRSLHDGVRRVIL